MRTTAAAALVLLCATGPGCTGVSPDPPLAREPSRSPEALTIRYADPVNVDVRDVPVLVALDELASRGYRIERLQIAGPPLIADMLSRGEIELGVLNYQTMWAAIAKGADARSVVQFASPTTVLAASDAIRSCRDLDGREMGVSGTSGLSQILIQIYLTERCGGAKPQLMVFPESAGRAAALLAGRIDAAVMPGEELIKLQLSSPGRLKSLMTHTEEFPEIRIDGFHVRRAWTAEHPASVRDFIRALLSAQRRLTADPALLYAEAQRRLGLDAATTRAIADSHLRMRIWDPNGGLTERRVAHTIDFLEKAGALPHGLTPGQVADFSHLEAVLDEIGRAE